MEHANKLGGRTLIFGLPPNAVSASVAGRKSEAVADHDKPLVRRLLADKQKQPECFNHLCVSQSSLNALFGPLWFLLISRNKIAVISAVFAGFHWMLCKIAVRLFHTFPFLKLLLTFANTLATLSTLQSRNMKQRLHTTSNSVPDTLRYYSHNTGDTLGKALRKLRDLT